MTWLDSLAEQQIREAMARGEFDDLPGQGKPLDLGDPDDPHWWVRKFMEREQLSLADALPPGLALRKQAEGFPESLREIASEKAVREVLADYNAAVRREIRRPVVGPALPLLAHTVGVNEIVREWRELRRADRLAREAAFAERAGHGTRRPARNGQFRKSQTPSQNSDGSSAPSSSRSWRFRSRPPA